MPAFVKTMTELLAYFTHQGKTFYKGTCQARVLYHGCVIALVEAQLA
jgi:hypothetical protein